MMGNCETTSNIEVEIIIGLAGIQLIGAMS